MKTTTVKSKQELYLEIPQEYLDQLGLQEGDVVSMDVKDCAIVIQPTAPIELDFEDLHKDTLVAIILKAKEHDCSIDEAISYLLEEGLAASERLHDSDFSD